MGSSPYPTKRAHGHTVGIRCPREVTTGPPEEPEDIAVVRMNLSLVKHHLNISCNSYNTLPEADEDVHHIVHKLGSL